MSSEALLARARRYLERGAEEDIRTFSRLLEFPILPCDLCGSQDNLQRKVVGKLIDDLEAKHPGMKQVMLAAVQNVRPSQLLDQRLWKQLGLEAARETTNTIPVSNLLRAEA